LAFQCPFVQARPSDPTISGGFKQVFAASSKGFPSHPADARHFPKAREKRLFAGPSILMRSQKVRKSLSSRGVTGEPFSLLSKIHPPSCGSILRARLVGTSSFFQPFG
ncbi:MAG: hypothetical protein AB1547_01365, partial [Thermodesulfobacteriota bacterium]